MTSGAFLSFALPSPMLDRIAVFTAVYLIFACVPLAVYAFVRTNKPQHTFLLAYGAATSVFSYLLFRIIVAFYYSPRPFVESSITPLIVHSGDNGFPSDHTLVAAIIATTIFPYHKKIGAVLWAIALLVGFARVYAGIHHTVDVLGSVAIALVAGVAAYPLVRRLLRFHVAPNR